MGRQPTKMIELTDTKMTQVEIQDLNSVNNNQKSKKIKKKGKKITIKEKIIDKRKRNGKVD